MGSECSVEKDYELDERVECNSKEWSLFAARRKQDEFRATVFVHEKSKKEKKKNDERIATAAQVTEYYTQTSHKRTPQDVENCPV